MNSVPDNDISFVAKATAAFEQAAWAVVKRARETNTPVIIWQDGKTVSLTADVAEQMLQQRSQKA